MDFAKVTRIIIVAVTLGLIGFDVAAFINPQICNTISCVMLTWSSQHPFLVLVAGILMGHLFLPQTRIKILGRPGWLYIGKFPDVITDADIWNALEKEKKKRAS